MYQECFSVSIFTKRCNRRYHGIDHITKTTINLISNNKLPNIASKYATFCRENRPSVKALLWGCICGVKMCPRRSTIYCKIVKVIMNI